MEILMSHVMGVYVMTCHMSRHNQVSQLKPILMKLLSYSDSNSQKTYKLPILMMKLKSNIAHTCMSHQV